MGNTGLLLMRLSFGIYSAYYGFPKLFSGVATWEHIGGSLAVLGITFTPAIWGFILAAIEFIGGICLALGIFFKGSSFLLFLRYALLLLIAIIGHAGLDSLFPIILHTSVYLGIFLLGEGDYALGRMIR